MQEAHFLAAVQIVVYAGAIVILFLFVIMLLGVDKAEDLGVEPTLAKSRSPSSAPHCWPRDHVRAVATDGATGVALATPNVARFRITDIERIGRVLFTEYAVAFQLTAALLTIGVIGAVCHLARSTASMILSRRDGPPVAGAGGPTTNTMTRSRRTT